MTLLPWNRQVELLYGSEKKDELDGFDEYWYRVRLSGQEGWVYDAYLLESPLLPPDFGLEELFMENDGIEYIASVPWPVTHGRRSHATFVFRSRSPDTTDGTSSGLPSGSKSPRAVCIPAGASDVPSEMAAFDEKGRCFLLRPFVPEVPAVWLQDGPALSHLLLVGKRRRERQIRTDGRPTL